MVKAGNDGAAGARSSDVGRVELGAETYSANLRFIGLEASGMGIQLLPSANALEVYQGVMNEMARLEKSFPPGSSGGSPSTTWASCASRSTKC